MSNAQQLLAGWSDPEETSQLGEAKSFLKELLATGSVSAKEIYKEAKSAGVSERTLERAKVQLGIRSRKVAKIAIMAILATFRFLAPALG